MAKHDDRVYLAHIIDCIDKITGYIDNANYNNFANNNLVIDAVVRNFEIIGEASNNVSESFKETHPEINFRSAISMRNWLAHGYDDVDLQVVWNTATKDLPKMKEQIKSLVN